MVNIKKLKSALKENGISFEEAADAIGFDRVTFYRRINRNGESFTVKEIDALSRLLNMNSKTLQSIFFDRQLAETQADDRPQEG